MFVNTVGKNSKVWVIRTSMKGVYMQENLVFVNYVDTDLSILKSNLSELT